MTINLPSRKLVALQAVADEELEKLLREQAEAFGYISITEYERVAKLDSEEVRETVISQKVRGFLENKVVYKVTEKE